MFFGSVPIRGTGLFAFLIYSIKERRLNTITDDVPPGLYFATGNTSIEGGVCDWIRKFKKEHPTLTFVAIDTFQLIRTATADVSYGNDYAELQPLRELAEELQICLLLVHHLRKMGDKDPINKLSGSTGIAGAVDAIYVLEKNERMPNRRLISTSPTSEASAVSARNPLMAQKASKPPNSQTTEKDRRPKSSVQSLEARITQNILMRRSVT